MGQTPNLSLPYPELDDSADVPRDIKALAVALDPLVKPLVNPPYVTALPGAPVDGQECYLQTAAMAAAGVIWHLRYRASIADAYKWEFLGGAPMTVRQDATYTLPGGQASYVPPSNAVTLTVPVAGIYDVAAEADIWHGQVSSFNSTYYSYTVGPTVASDTWCAALGIAAAIASVSKTYRHTVTSPFTLIERVRTTAVAGTTCPFNRRRLSALPVRVG